MNKNLKRIIILLIIFTIIIITIIGILMLKKSKEEIGANELEIDEDAYNFEFNKLTEVQSRNEYYNAKKCVELFYNYISTGNTEKTYSLLDEEYIKMTNLTREQLKTENMAKGKLDINKMYTMKASKEIDAYFLYGKLIDTSKVSDLAIGVKIDTANSTFSILPYEYMKEKNILNIDKNSKVILENIGNLKNKTYNVFKPIYINDEQYVKYIFETFTERMTSNTEQAYKDLEESYRRNRFENIQDFEKYANQNKELYLSYNSKNAKQYGDFDSMEEYMLYMAKYKPLELKSYKIDKKSNYTQYVLIDNLENYYIFRETAVMNYTVILDTYTIDLPEFVEKYEKATEEDKVILNLQKCFEALNNKDYKYVYNKLDSTFKTNNFKTEVDFEKYIKTNFFESNKAKSSNGKKQGDVYTYEITITDKAEKETKTVKKTFVMKLKEGTDFVMSFEV